MMLSFYIVGTGRTLQRKGLPGMSGQGGGLGGGWERRHLVEPAPNMGREHHPLWSCLLVLEITFLKPSWHRNESSHTDWMLWSSLACAGVCTFSAGALSLHSLLWPRMSHSKQQLLLQIPQPFTTALFPSLPSHSIGRTSAPFQRTPTVRPCLFPTYTAEGGLFAQQLQTSSSLSKPASFSALWGLNHTFSKEVWTLSQFVLPWWLSLSPRVLYIISLYITVTLLS